MARGFGSLFSLLLPGDAGLQYPRELKELSRFRFQGRLLCCCVLVLGRWLFHRRRSSFRFRPAP